MSSSISINLPADVLEAIQKVSTQMRLTSEEFVQMALSFFMQQNVAELAIIAIERMEDGAKPFDYSDIQESYELGFSIHPDAKEELEQLDAEQQAALLESLFMKITEQHSDEGLDLVLQDFDDFQLIYSRLAEIDIIYTLSEKGVTVYLLHPFIELEPSDEGFEFHEVIEDEDDGREYPESFDDEDEPYRNH
jgi:hypothetical protein